MEEVSGLRRIYSCSQFVYFNLLFEDWKLNNKKRSAADQDRLQKEMQKFVSLYHMERKFS